MRDVKVWTTVWFGSKNIASVSRNLPHKQPYTEVRRPNGARTWKIVYGVGTDGSVTRGRGSGNGLEPRKDRPKDSKRSCQVIAAKVEPTNDGRTRSKSSSIMDGKGGLVHKADNRG